MLKVNLLAFCFFLLIGGCGQGGPPPDEPAADSAAAEQQPELTEEANDGTSEAEPDEPVNETAMSTRPAADSVVRNRPLKFNMPLHGFEYFDGFIGSTRFVMVRILSRSINLYSDSSKGNSGRATSYILKETGARAVLSGGFLQSYSPALPMGYVQVNGEIINRPHSVGLFNGAIVLGGIKADVIRVSSEKEFYSFGELGSPSSGGSQSATQRRDYLQSGPLLVFGGQEFLEHADQDTLNDLEGLYNRAFFCVSQRGRSILGVTGKIRLTDLARILATDQQSGGLGCDAALNLSGARSASIVFRGKSKLITFGDTGFRNATAIVVDGRF